MSPSPSSPSRRAVGAALLIAALVLGGCTQGRQTPERYGDTTRDNFTEGCVDSMRASDGAGEALSAREADAVCTCAYEGISGEDGIPFEEFKEINSAQEEEPRELDERIKTIVDGCMDSEVADR